MSAQGAPPQVDRGGALVIDKPTGCTSHDMVYRGRRALQTKAVGHVGTLDPAATGVLVLVFGEATKLSAYLVAEKKRYEATIALGSETDTLDADGAVTQTAQVPKLSQSEIAVRAKQFVGPYLQEVPAISAVKVEGQPLHRRARRGERVKPPSRMVELQHVEVFEVNENQVKLRLTCSKGFFVRSFARDLAAALGTLGHVVDLRRTASGKLTLADSVPGDAFEQAVRCRDRAQLAPWCLPLEHVWNGETVELLPGGVDDAKHGRPVSLDRTIAADVAAIETGTVCALMDPGLQNLIALGRKEPSCYRIVRGLRMA